MCCVSAELRRCEERGELLLPLVFLLLVVLSVLLYFSVSLMDPGFVHPDTVKVQHKAKQLGSLCISVAMCDYEGSAFGFY